MRIESPEIDRIELIDAPEMNVSALTELTPRLPIAICPYCGQIYTEAMETGGAGFWALREGHGNSVFSSASEPRHCSHFVLVQRFLLPGDESDEQPGEAPYVMGSALDESLKTCAVMNAMPLFYGGVDGRLNRYRLFTITYYAESSYQVGKARRRMRQAPDENETAHVLAPPADEASEREWRDLRAWVAKGRLSWLEKGEKGPQRCTGPADDFPY